MVVLTLGEDQQVPWHWHTNVPDRFFCKQGPMVVETRLRAKSSSSTLVIPALCLPGAPIM
jgi:hypothetical protein